MTNSYDVDHGLSQCPPGPLEPVEIAQQPGAAPATGNTARDQEMYAAGIRTGEENTKHNAAIRAGAAWQPIDTAPKDGTEIWAHNGEQARMRWVEGECYALWIWADDLLADADPSPEQPTYWQPVPAAPGVSTVEDPSFPTGAIANGRVLADRLEAYPFESQGGDLRLCSDWVEFRRCFEYLAEWVGSRAPAAGDALDAARYRWLRDESLGVPDGMREIYVIQQRLPHTEGTDTELFDTALDAAVDAAITAQRKGDA